MDIYSHLLKCDQEASGSLGSFPGEVGEDPEEFKKVQ